MIHRERQADKGGKGAGEREIDKEKVREVSRDKSWQTPRRRKTASTHR